MDAGSRAGVDTKGNGALGLFTLLVLVLGLSFMLLLLESSSLVCFAAATGLAGVGDGDGGGSSDMVGVLKTNTPALLEEVAWRY